MHIFIIFQDRFAGDGVDDTGFTPPDPTTPDTPPNAAGAADNPDNITATGGLAGFATNVLVPMKGINGDFFFALFDPTNFNTEVDCQHNFRQEEIFPGHQITVSRVRIIYRNLGLCFLTATIFTSQHTTQVDKVNSQTKQLGTRLADLKLYTDYFDISLTGERPQLVLTRLANDGPISIISSQLITDVEVAEQI